MKKQSFEEAINNALGKGILKLYHIFFVILLFILFIGIIIAKIVPVQVQDRIQIQIDSTEFDTDALFEYVVDTLDNGDIYTTASFHPSRPITPLRGVTVILPDNEHCFKYTVTSILKDGKVSTYSNESCLRNGISSDNITLHIKNEAVNIVTVCSYNENHHVSERASFLIITT